MVDPDEEPEEVEPARHAAIAEGPAQVERGDFASDDKVAAAFRRVGR